MDKTSSIIAALDAGKLPTQRQLNAFIDWLLLNIIPSDTPELDKLTPQGGALARGFADMLTAYKQLGSNKNCAFPTFLSPALLTRSQMMIWSNTPSGISPRATCLPSASKPSTSRRRLQIWTPFAPL